MRRDEYKAWQRCERKKCLDAILKSTARKKMIVSGPGTGKTFIFAEVLKQKSGGCNLAMTFIRRLVRDMEEDLSQDAEVKTFHGYCKKILHQQNQRVDLVPYLTKIVEKDAELVGAALGDFDAKFQSLEERSPEVAFYLRRGDYYEVVSFDDSVYRLYKILKDNPEALPEFNQIVIDEFQDFNPLEVAFISELEKKGPILIVGDDDQAVYDQRCASPWYLRKKCWSGTFDVFELPFCSRSPEVIVEAAKSVANRAVSLGHLDGRIPKRYECYLDDKESDSYKYPKVILARCTTRSVIPKYIAREVGKICEDDIVESKCERDVYPTVLIVGPKHYLAEIEKQLRPIYPSLSYSPSEDTVYSVAEGYERILGDGNSNLGWRILVGAFCDVEKQKAVIAGSEHGTSMIELLDKEFIREHSTAVDVIRKIKDEGEVGVDDEAELQAVVGDYFDEVVEHFRVKEESKGEPEVEEGGLSILLTSYLGCKGLSGGHVFIVGVNNGSMPKDVGKIRDVEISRFVVALTRARKQCHIISNRWLIGPKDRKGRWVPEFERSVFISWIPSKLVEDGGTFKAADFEADGSIE